MANLVIEEISEDEFYNKFSCRKNHFDKNAGFGGCMFETYGQQLSYIFEMSKTKRVVTIIEGDENSERTFIGDEGYEITEPLVNLYYASGFHFVNRLGYFVLDKPYDKEFEVKVD